MHPSEPLPPQCDVVVAGSGPAGCNAAYWLAREGVNVVLVEKGSPPRYKTCGGGIVRRALQFIPTTIQQSVHRECTRAELHLHDAGLHFVTTRSAPIVSMTMRSEFDSLLLGTAQAAGAIFVPRCSVTGVCSQEDAIVVQTTLGEIRATFAVAADGALSTIARKAGWQETRTLVPAIEYEVPLDNYRANGLDCTARFDFGIVPFGYGWVFPKRTHVSVGILSTRPHATDLHAALRGYLRITGIHTDARTERHGFVIPMRPRSDGFATRRIILVGDAAGLADPLTGEGITFALQSGKLAAQSLVQGKFRPGKVEQQYDAALARYVLPELRFGSVLATLLYNHASLRAWFFRRHGQRFCEAVTNVMTGATTYRDLLFRPSNLITLLLKQHTG